MQLPDLKGVRNASENLQGVSVLTPLVINERLSNDLNCKIYLNVKIFSKLDLLKFVVLLIKLDLLIQTI